MTVNNNKVTLVDALLAVSQSDDTGIRIVSSSKETCFLSYVELYKRSMYLLGGVQKSGLTPGTEIIIMFRDIEQFLTTFWMCLLGGYTAVPLSVPDTKEGYSKLNLVLETLKHGVVFSSHSESLDDVLLGTLDGQLFYYEDIDTTCAGVRKAIARDDCAFIQFSSGSTSSPKGVVLTHRNLVANIVAITTASKITSEDSTLSWMPLTHDMGLIGFHLTPLYNGIDQAIMPTRLFIFRPLLWMGIAEKYGYSLLSSPNFGYKYFLDLFKRRAGTVFDLKNVRLIFNGAEPINADICRSFHKTLKPFGLSEQAMFPVYGLAEGSLAVTMPPPEDSLQSVIVDRRSMTEGCPVEFCNMGDTHGVELVCVGKAVSSCTIMVTDGDGIPYPDGHIGLLFIKGESVTQGYYSAALNDTLFIDGWLNTGDLGFVYNESVFITGRVKDVLFLHGANVYAHDIENAAEKIGIEGLGRYAAVAKMNEESGLQELCLFASSKITDYDTLKDLSVQLRTKLAADIGVRFDTFITIPKLPLTTSGKIQRHVLQGKLEVGDQFETEIRYTEHIKIEC